MTQMLPFSFDELLPQPAEFKLRVLGETFHIRPISLVDRRWMHKTYGDELEEIFGKIKTDEIMQIAFQMLTDESKLKLKARTVERMNPAGEVTTETIGGVKLLEAMVTDVQELLAIYRALLTSIGFSEPVLKKLDDAAAAEKKRNEEAMTTASTGSNPSTSSPPSTDGVSSRSAG